MGTLAHAYEEKFGMKKLTKIIATLAAVFALALVPTTAFAQSDDADLTQQINGGTLTAAILDASRVVVPSPSFAMTAATFSFSCQTATGTLGSGSQRLYVINPSGTTTGQSWTLTLAATGPWSDGGSNTYTHNDAAGSGCTNGQLTVNATPATLTADCVSAACTGASITKGSSTAMTGSTAVTLLTAPTNTHVYRGYLTGVTLSQQIPAEKPAATYTLPVTITATAV